MKTRTLATVAILTLAGVAPLHAELKYTLRMDVKKSTAKPSAPADPGLAGLGVMVTDMLLPGGSVELGVTTGERGTRIEPNKGFAGMPAGTVVLVRPDGSITGFDPAAKTFWRSPAPDAGGGIQAKTRRTGEISSVSGERVERVTFQMTLPLGSSGKTPPITLEGEAWVAERFKKYSASKYSGLTGALALFQLADLGLSMRQVIRGQILGDREIEALVSKVAEEPVAPSLFDVPAGFKEVPGPGKIGG
jgi:hypothetical protein